MTGTREPDAGWTMVLLSALAAMLIGGTIGIALVLVGRGAFRPVLSGGGGDAADRRRLLRSVVAEELRTLWPTHRCRLILLLCLCGTGGAVLGSAATAGRPVTAFVYTYPFGPTAGLRAWRLDGLGRWHERGPDGREARLFDVTVRDVAGGCRGASTRARARPEFEFFVPDAGCRTMALMMRRGGGPWSSLEPMTLTSTAAAPRD